MSSYSVKKGMVLRPIATTRTSDTTSSNADNFKEIKTAKVGIIMHTGSYSQATRMLVEQRRATWMHLLKLMHYRYIFRIHPANPSQGPTLILVIL